MLKPQSAKKDKHRNHAWSSAQPWVRGSGAADLLVLAEMPVREPRVDLPIQVRKKPVAVTWAGRHMGK